uniref:Uncharacterized protein n=1 Tax=Acrobeloides nanus TaxID=290746 RepID=A0A914DUC5_9BILA
MVNLKQEFELYDYLGPVAVALAFAIIVLFLSFFLLNYCLISKEDEVTVFERFGSRHNVRLGPHSLDSIRRRKQRQAEIEAEQQQQSSKLISSNKGTSGNAPIIQIPQVKIDDASS